MFTIGIDASNILRGGGRTHLIEILSQLESHKIKKLKIIVWGRKDTLNLIPTNYNIIKLNNNFLEKNLLFRIVWQLFYFSNEAKKYFCDIILIPGGSYLGSFHPRVVMCQNMLPFEYKEIKRFGFSFLSIKLLILRFIQSRSFEKSDGLIFLSNYAENTIKKVCKNFSGESKIIPHGINQKFNQKPKIQRDISYYTIINPFKIVYVSIIDQYKHQWNVVEAISKLRNQTGWPIELELIGPSYKPALKKLKIALKIYDPSEKWVKYIGEIDYNILESFIFKADIGIFASSCENMPNILMEKMLSGIPLVCSNKGPMPEFLKLFGIYFNPDNVDEIVNATQQLIQSTKLRTLIAEGAYKDSLKYTWENCAISTFSFLKDVSKIK